jgi:monofunctional biosynthetic peptidoglycan transglycosylase
VNRTRMLWRRLLSLLALLALAVISLQLYFLARIALMSLVDPASTSFQRSEAARLALTPGLRWRWRQEWVDLDRLPTSVMRAVLASEDAGFVEHSGVEWEAIEKAWQRNRQAEERAERAARTHPARARPARLRGGSTVTQQLAKNLLLSGERTLARKGQELLLTWMLEALLSKRRILEIYLNHVEWGEGVFGVQAAAQHYFGIDATRLSAEQAARLAVMLPAPKRFEKRPQSAYVLERAATILARMPAVAVP